MPKAKDLNQRNNSQFFHRATSIFTDREDLRNAYHNLLNRALTEEFSEYYAILYYGIGGVGKTRLLKKLMEEVGENEQYRTHQPIILHVDFDSPGMYDSIRALLHLKKQFCRLVSRAYFPLFDTALFLIRQRTGEDFETDQQINDIFDNPIMAFGLELLDSALGTVFLDAARRAALKLSKEARQWLVRRKNDLKTVLQEMKLLDENALLRNLTDYFASDINRMMVDEPSRVICMFLDTYERLNSFEYSEHRPYRAYQRDEWVHGSNGLMRLMGNTVFAIAGRHRPAWADEDPLWKEPKNLEKHLTKGLSEENTREFLFRNHITNHQIQTAIFRLTNGEPVYLDLCVRQYKDLLATSVPRAEDFGSSINELIDRHLRYIKDEMRDELCLMASMQRWTDELYDDLTQQIGMNAVRSNSSSYQQLMQLSYIDVNGQTNDVHTMHSVVAGLLALRLPGKIKEKAIVCLCEAWRQKYDHFQEDCDLILEAALSTAGWHDIPSRQAIPNQTINPEITILLAHTLQHRAAQEKNALRRIYWRRYSYSIVQSYFGTTDHRTVAELIRLCDDYCCSGHYLEAATLLQEKMAQITALTGECNQTTVDLLVALAKVREHMQQFDKHVELLNKAYELQKQLSGETCPRTLELLLKRELSSCYDDNEYLRRFYHCFELFSACYGQTHEKTHSIMKLILYRMIALARPHGAEYDEITGKAKYLEYAIALIALATPYATVLLKDEYEREALWVRRVIAEATVYIGRVEEAYVQLYNDLETTKRLYGTQHEEVLWQLIYLEYLCPEKHKAAVSDQITAFIQNHPCALTLLEHMLDNIDNDRVWAAFILLRLKDKAVEAAIKETAPNMPHDMQWLFGKANHLEAKLKTLSSNADTEKFTTAHRVLTAVKQLTNSECTIVDGTTSILAACMQYSECAEDAVPDLNEDVLDILISLATFLHNSDSARMHINNEERHTLHIQTIQAIQNSIQLQIVLAGEMDPEAYESKERLLQHCEDTHQYDIAAVIAKQMLDRQTAAYGKNHGETLYALERYVSNSLNAGHSVDKQQIVDHLREAVQTRNSQDGWNALLRSESICCFLLGLPVVWIELCDLHFRQTLLTDPECMIVDRSDPDYPLPLLAKNSSGRAMGFLYDALEEYLFGTEADTSMLIGNGYAERIRNILQNLLRIFEQYYDLGGIFTCEAWIAKLTS